MNGRAQLGAEARNVLAYYRYLKRTQDQLSARLWARCRIFNIRARRAQAPQER